MAAAGNPTASGTTAVLKFSDRAVTSNSQAFWGEDLLRLLEPLHEVPAEGFDGIVDVGREISRSHHRSGDFLGEALQTGRAIDRGSHEVKSKRSGVPTFP